MNILYIAAVHGKKYSGITASVPKHIASQAKLNNVFWYNICSMQEPVDCPVPCHSVEEYPSLNIADLPAPFNKPDLVIFEEVYLLKFIKLARQARALRIPYIIAPHGSLTAKAQRRSFLKKKIANGLLFKRFIKQAAAIQYLTMQERDNSGLAWNPSCYVVPNGTDIPTADTHHFCKHNSLKGVFIGRLDVYYKGLDLLFQAIAQAAPVLRQAHVLIDVYGAGTLKQEMKLKKWISDYNLADLLQLHAPVYDAQKAAVLCAHDFFILTSRSEGHPMGLIEAMAYGLPCLATTGTNLRQEIEKYNAGWTSDTTVSDISRALCALVNQREELALKGAQARRLAAQYDWAKIACQSNEIYQNILKTRCERTI